MFHDKGSKLVVNLGYQLVKKKLGFMIINTLFILCYSSKGGLSWDSYEHNIIHYIIAMRNNSLSQSIFKRTNKHHSALLIKQEC